MDYPPLCAYWHAAVGGVHKYHDTMTWQATLTSKQGEDETEFIVMMRATVIIGEFLVFAPALFFLLKTMFKDLSTKIRLVLWFGIMMLPPAMFIDHGHYQFNQIMHGFVLLAVAFVLRDHFKLATFCMVLAVNFKQTALYFALPFVVYVVARLTIIHHSPNISIQIQTVINRCMVLGVVFVATNLLIWKPFLFPDNKLNFELASMVWNRVFPVRRGIFEDKVATFWCVLHYCTPLKPNNWFDRSFQFKMTMLTTLAACLPSCYYLFLAPTRKQLLYCLFCVSIVFFMFGFQVHEKQILSPNLIFVLLLGDLTEWMTLFTFMSSWSMWMLYTNDFNHFNYIAMQFAAVCGGRVFEQFASQINEADDYSDKPSKWTHFTTLVWMSDSVKPASAKEGRFLGLMRRHRNLIVTCLINFALLFHVIEQVIQPPVDKPDLWRVLNNLFNLLFFMLMTVYVHFKMAVESIDFSEQAQHGMRKKFDDPKVHAVKPDREKGRPAGKDSRHKQ